MFELSGGDLALDFANTVSGRSRSVPVDHLSDYDRLVAWGEQAGVLTEPQGSRLRTYASSRSRAATAALRRAIMLREAIFSLFAAVAAGDPLSESALSALNEFLPAALSRLRVEREGKSFSLRLSSDEEDLDAVLHPVVRAGAELLTSDRRERVRECRADTCAWLFLDQSKNATRCWCDMNICGNRAKARRHYARGKAATHRPSSRPRT